ncbi:hypothetical protein JSY36_05505 [Bacillus sp. H-16]|uniref:hypothetical protein n=1 Tax=Alteribacter salitolerans TaxID=2912333 RepID=UPI0019636662|nr:hypothetical protein [Alteribacter salitolerans]MBM7095208.1 hypothetical protein [Alteribacter salitolerans]
MAVTRMNGKRVSYCTVLGSMSLLISGNHSEKIDVLQKLRASFTTRTIESDPSILLCFSTIFSELKHSDDAGVRYELAKTIFAFTKHTGIYFDLAQLRWIERIAAYEPDEKVSQELENIIFWHENFMYCEIMGGGVKTYFTEVKKHFPNAPVSFSKM